MLVWLRVPGVVVQVSGRAAEPVAVIWRLCGKGGDGLVFGFNWGWVGPVWDWGG